MNIWRARPVSQPFMEICKFIFLSNCCCCGFCLWPSSEKKNQTKYQRVIRQTLIIFGILWASVLAQRHDYADLKPDLMDCHTCMQLICNGKKIWRFDSSSYLRWGGSGMLVGNNCNMLLNICCLNWLSHLYVTHFQWKRWRLDSSSHLWNVAKKQFQNVAKHLLFCNMLSNFATWQHVASTSNCLNCLAFITKITISTYNSSHIILWHSN